MTGTKAIPTITVESELTPLDSAHVAVRRVPTRVRIAPWGEVESSSGRFIVDDESARLVLEAFAEQGTDLPVDYEHQTLGGSYASPNGQAPAAGWIKSLSFEPGEGIFAEVEWTEPALEQLAAKQYRYLSPVALVRKSDRKLIALHSAALTNKPAIVGAEPIVNAQPATTAAARSLRLRLDLSSNADVETILLAANRRFEDDERQRAAEAAEARITEAVRAGRCTEAQRGVALQLAMSDAELFDEWLRTAPVVVPLGRTVAPVSHDGATTTHTVANSARAEYRAHRELAALTSEDSYVADAVRRHAVDQNV